jgi:hydroxyethylthiazole kinase-like uncharacterized protein yjeF
MKILTAEQMREIDRLTAEDYGTPSIVLMENAGLNLYLELARRFSDLDRRRIMIVCGKGNNGGDGMVLARQLVQRDMRPQVTLLAGRSEVTGDARVQLEILDKSGIALSEADSMETWRQAAGSLASADIVVDAIFGTGLSKPVEGLYREVIEAINRTNAFVLAVDIPSGMPSDSPVAAQSVVRADLTVTFTAPKIAHILNTDQEAIGELVVVPIGSPRQLLENDALWLRLITPGRAAAAVLPRRKSSHKGDFGHVAVIAGSRGKAGAALLASRAALRAGSGLVTAFTPRDAQAVVASAQAEIMTEGLASTDQGSFAESAAGEALALLDGKDAVALGPGLSRHPETEAFARQMVRESPLPLVLDADGLNAFAGHAELLKNARGLPLVLTPHPGEFSRLIGKPTGEILAKPHEYARAFAVERGVWLVLKGFRTILAAPDGQLDVSDRGNPGMATGGSGDALTGVLVSLLGLRAARKMTAPADIRQALALGIYLHGLAGDLAAASCGEEALTAGSIIDFVGEAYRLLRKPSAEILRSPAAR